MIDWRMGRMSQRQIADKHGVSNGKVAQLTKGVAQDSAAIVSAGIEYRQALQTQDERMVSAVEKEVDKVSGWVNWIHTALMSNAQQAMKDKCSDQDDYLKRGNTLAKAKESIVGKQPDTVINNTNALQAVIQYTPEQLRQINQDLEDAC
jgi:hypothetical protein